MKKRKLLLATLAAALCACLGVFAAACGGQKPSDQPQTYSIVFDMHGHGTQISPITDIVSGSKIEKPEDPTADEWTFGGWYRSDAFEIEWNFETDTVTSSRKLHALWTPVTYVVTFEMNGIGVAVPAQTGIAKGGKATEPTAPSATGYVFTGWYQDDGLTTEWNFATDTISANTTIYASWKQIHEVAEDRENGTIMTVSDYEYFTVPITGNYVIDIKGNNDNASVGGTDDSSDGTQERDDDFLIDNVYYKKSNRVVIFLEEGRHTIRCIGAEYEAEVTFDEYDLPFSEVAEYIGDRYTLRVNALGTDGNGKFSVVSVWFGEGDRVTSANSTNAVAFDGTYYTLSCRALSGSVYVYFNVRIKINADNSGNVTSINVYTQTSGEWNMDEVADTLERARTANEVVSTAFAPTEEGIAIEEEVARTFAYVYISVEGYKDRWLEFSGVAAGTSFYWVDLSASRTGDIAESINIVNGDPIRLSSRYNCIAVRPAAGSNRVSFTVKLSNGPQGLVESNPIVIQNNAHTINNTVAGTSYYLEYTAAEAGAYKVTVTRSTGDGMQYPIGSFSVDGASQNAQNLLNGVEVQLTAGVHKIIVAPPVYSGGTISLSFEKIVLGELTSGTFKGTKSPYAYTFVINAADNTVTVSRVHAIMGGTPSVGGENLPITENNGVYNFTTNTDYIVNVSFTATADGSSIEVTIDGVTFTAEKQIEQAPAFPVGTYRYSNGSFSDPNTFTLVVSGDLENGYTVDYTDSAGYIDATGVDLVYANNVYSFTYFDSSWNGNVTIKLISWENDVIVVENYEGYADASTETAEFTAGEIEAEINTYSGTLDNNVAIILVIDLTNSKVTYTKDGVVVAEDVALTQQGYSMGFDYSGGTVTIYPQAGGLQVMDGTNYCLNATLVE